MNNFVPQKLKKKKSFKRLRLNLNKEQRHYVLRQGIVGLKALNFGQLNPEILEMARRHLRRKLGKGATIKIFVYPTTPLFKKPTGSRMGKGYGKLLNWVYPIRTGKIFLELSDINILAGITALNSLKKKIPFRTKIVKNDDI